MIISDCSHDILNINITQYFLKESSCILGISSRDSNPRVLDNLCMLKGDEEKEKERERKRMGG